MLARNFALPLLMFVAGSAHAVTYVVPPDRIEIERAGAIVVGRALDTKLQTTRYGTEAVTDFAVEEVIKGRIDSVISLYEPAGPLDSDQSSVIFEPRFEPSERLLLLLYERSPGQYAVLDLHLGAFRFVRDATGRELLRRDEAELIGWDLDGGIHREPQREALPFLDYVRAIVRGEESSFAERLPSASPAQDGRHVAPATSFTATSYMLYYGTGLGGRWKDFPAAVEWNQGSLETGPRGSGATQIATAFEQWNGGGTNYVLASATANSNGFYDPSDGVNNIVFEKNLTARGIQPFSCTSGGVLGVGGLTRGNFGAGVHVFNGETFGTALEADVSMNQGLGACTTSQLTLDQFQSVIVHELGHTLGFRHSDQNRQLTAACSTDPTLDCSGSAIMNHILLSGLNGNLQAWDTTALARVYGSAPSCDPPSILSQPQSATIDSGSSVQLSVTAGGTTPFTYQWFKGMKGDMSKPVSGANGATLSVAPVVTTSYWVEVSGSCAPPADSNTATVTVRAVCPAVVLGTPTFSTVGESVRLSISASGGSSFTYLWYQGNVSGNGSPVGQGNPLTLFPMVTTSYWCRVTNECEHVTDSVVVTVPVVACVPPRIVSDLRAQTVAPGASVPLQLEFEGDDSTVSWFRGAKGDTTSPVGTGRVVMTGPLSVTTHFWARVANGCGVAEGEGATITVKKSGRRRTVRP